MSCGIAILKKKTKKHIVMSWKLCKHTNKAKGKISLEQLFYRHHRSFYIRVPIVRVHSHSRLKIFWGVKKDDVLSRGQ